MLASSYPVLDAFLTMLYFFLFIIWIWLLIMVFMDVFRSHDMGGWAKALWVIFIIVLPFLGVFVYLIARGGKMHERAAQQAAQQQKAFDQYVKQAAGTPVSPRPTSSTSWPTSSRRACSPTPSSRPRRPSPGQLGSRSPVAGYSSPVATRTTTNTSSPGRPRPGRAMPNTTRLS